MKVDTTLLELSKLDLQYVLWQINQKRIYSSKGHYSVKTECMVIVHFLCISSDEAVYLKKIS